MTETVTLAIEGMSCEGCVRRVRKLLENTGEGTVQEVRIGSATVETSGSASAEKLTATLNEAGYHATVRN